MCMVQEIGRWQVKCERLHQKTSCGGDDRRTGWKEGRAEGEKPVIER